MLKILISLAILGITCGCSEKQPKAISDSPQQGNEGSTAHGGDVIKLLFTKAKEDAAQKVLQVKFFTLPQTAKAEDKEWLIENREKLAADILESTHVWLEEGNKASYCAKVRKRKFAEKIYFSLPDCRETVHNELDAQKILIHESTHHLGLTDSEEEKADRIALLVIEAKSTDGVGAWSAMHPYNTPKFKDADGYISAYADKHLVLWGHNPADQNNCTDPALGKIYNIKAGKWADIRTGGALRYRQHATAVSTNSALGVFIWGGTCFDTTEDKITYLSDGAFYNPSNDSWETIVATENAPIGRAKAQAVFNGKKIILWGGEHDNELLNSGSVFDLATKTWTPLPTISIEESDTRWNNKIFWVDSSAHNGSFQNKLILLQLDIATEIEFLRINTLDMNNMEAGWSQIQSSPIEYYFDPNSVHITFAEGNFIFYQPDHIPKPNGNAIAGVTWDSQADTWGTIPIAYAPSQREDTATIWSGTELIVFGGQGTADGNRLSSGSIYNPTLNKWRPMTINGAVSPRSNSIAFWTGKGMIVWGGENGIKKNLPLGGIFYP